MSHSPPSCGASGAFAGVVAVGGTRVGGGDDGVAGGSDVGEAGSGVSEGTGVVVSLAGAGVSVAGGTVTVSTGTVTLGVAVGGGLGVSDAAATSVATAIGVGATGVAVGRLGTTRVLVGVGVTAGPPGRHWSPNKAARIMTTGRNPNLFRSTAIPVCQAEGELELLVDDVFVPALYQVLVAQFILGHGLQQIAALALALACHVAV